MNIINNWTVYLFFTYALLFMHIILESWERKTLKQKRPEIEARLVSRSFAFPLNFSEFGAPAIARTGKSS